MKTTKITDKEARAHGYFAYACGSSKYALHAQIASGESKLVKTFRRKCDALAYAMGLPKAWTP
jgi:hypothetical protein